MKKLTWHIFEYINQMRKEQRMRCRPERIILIRHGESEGNQNAALYSQVPDHKIQLTEKGKKQAKELGRKLKNLIGNEHLYFYYSPFLRCKQTTEYICQGIEDLVESMDDAIPVFTRERSVPNFPSVFFTSFISFSVIIKIYKTTIIIIIKKKDESKEQIKDENDPLQSINYHRQQSNGQIVALVEDPRLREQEWGNLQVIDKTGEMKKLREAGSDVFDRVSNFLQSLYRNFSDGPFGNKPDIKWNVVI
ncbi:glycerolphosphate mutase, partial [Reticulomyxa filosa]